MERKITKEELESKLKEIYKEGIDNEPLVQKCEWEEDGVLYHTWKINSGNGRIAYTNDAGIEQLNEAIKKDIMENYGTTTKDPSEDE